MKEIINSSKYNLIALNNYLLFLLYISSSFSLNFLNLPVEGQDTVVMKLGIKRNEDTNVNVRRDV